MLQSCSVIIPTLNEYSALRRLLPSLLVDAQQHHLDIIICDGGSTDLTCHYVRQLQSDSPNLTLLQTQRGRSKQMNAGAEQAQHSVLLFLHADTELPRNWFGLLADAMQAGCVWGRFNVRLSGNNILFRVIERLMNLRSCWTQVATGDQAIFVDRQVFQQVGMYPDLPLMEDIALSKRLRQQYSMACIKTPLITSSRRWEKQGIIKTVILMWQLRWAYFIGTPAEALAKRYYPHYQQQKALALIQVFSKLPLKGYVKTRLIPQLGEDCATRIHQYLLNSVLDKVQSQAIHYQLWLAQQQASDLKNHAYQQLDFKVQQGNGLGERMGWAIQQGLANAHKVMLMGTDCLDFKVTHISEMMNALDQHDIAFIPTKDGGFIAIACRVFDAQIFAQARFGTEHALQDVLNNIKRLSLSVYFTQAVSDIDTYDDVKQYPELLELIE